MWKAIAGMIDKEDKDQSVEIGLGDLEHLLQYMSIKLEHLSMSAQLKEDNSEPAGSRDMNREQLAFIGMYKNGQREILEAL
eukprot:14143902-Ditylum_brightwellii.AAC.1